MKVDRRTFVKGAAFAGGGALGIMLSPTPWYLMRDLAFWTQNWSWVPAPAPGEPSFEKSFCKICEGGCGLNVRKVDRRMVRIDGYKDHPVNKGSICPVGAAAIQMVYGPARVKTPLKQIGTRNNPDWTAVSWPDAIAEITRKIKELRNAKKSHTLACIANSSHSTTNQLFERFLHAVGSRNFAKMNSADDPQNMVLALMQGVDGRIAYDIEHTRHVLSFGCNLLDGWGACGRMYSTEAKRYGNDRRGNLEIIQIEPNLSITASKASRWVPVKPGTEAALALSIAYVLIDKKLYDKDFVQSHCDGFEDWQSGDGARHRGFKSEILARYSPPAVELITQVPAKDIEELACEFAAKKPSLALGGRGSGNLFVDLYEQMAIYSLNALVGNVGRTGGVSVQPDVPISPLPPVRMDKEASRGYAEPRNDGAGSKYPFSQYLPHNLDASKIGALFIHEANPYYSLPDHEAAREMFETVPYIVCFSSFMDESASKADLVLPLPTSFERWDDQMGVPGLGYPVYNLAHPLIGPLYESRNAGDILMGIAHELGGSIAESFPWNNTVEVLRERAKGLHESGKGKICVSRSATGTDAGSSDWSDSRTPESFPLFWSALVENACWYDPTPGHASTEEILKTSGKKFEFFSRRLQKGFGFSDDRMCMPHHSETPPSPEGFDLIIMPQNLIDMANNGLGTPPVLIKQLSDKTLVKNDLFVQMNPITAMYQGLRDGDTVILESTCGKVKVRVHTFAGVREGVVLIPLGFGHTAYDQFIRNKGVNAHQIVEAKKDAVSGFLVWWATPGKVYKA